MDGRWGIVFVYSYFGLRIWDAFPTAPWTGSHEEPMRPEGCSVVRPGALGFRRCYWSYAGGILRVGVTRLEGRKEVFNDDGGNPNGVGSSNKEIQPKKKRKRKRKKVRN